MKHASARLLLAALLTGSAFTASAANPFSDVSPTDWAYQAVESLSQQGVVEGYPDGTFQGQQNVTRYEIAQIIARLMAREDQLNAEQKASVEKLSAEYADELKQLGIRVDALENKVGNTKVYIGEARFQYIDRYDDIRKGRSNKEGEYGGRLRLTLESTVSEQTKVYGQFQTIMGLAGKELTDVNGVGDSDTTIRQLFAYHKFTPKVGVAIGQFPVKMGVTGYTYDGVFKGASLQIGDPKEGSRLTFAYGRAVDINPEYTGAMMHGLRVKGPNGQVIDDLPDSAKYPMPGVRLPGTQDDDVPAVFASYIYAKPLKFEGHVYKLRALGPVHNIVDAYGAALSWYPWKYLNLHGEYVKNDKKLPLNNEKPYGYTYGISYGVAHPFYPKSMLIGIDYVYSEAGTYFGGSSNDISDMYMGGIYRGASAPMRTPLGTANITDANGNLPAYMGDKLGGARKAGGAKFFLAKMQYVPVKGVFMEAAYGFNAKNMNDDKLENVFRFTTTFYFK